MVGNPPNGCGSPPARMTQSWGAGCPSGACTSDQLATSLNRSMAGERHPCKEICYWLRIDLAAGGTGSVSPNSKVTICPTRVVALVQDSAFNEVATATDVTLLDVFEIGNQNQVVGDPIRLTHLHPASYQIIPFVTDCIKAGFPFRLAVTGGPASGFVYIGLIGPAIG
jgi:hypothetical protein